MEYIRKFIELCRKFYSIYVIRTLWAHWFNPLYTLYFNLVFFPFRQAIRLPVFVYGWPRLYSQFGVMLIEGKCKMGMVKFNVTIPGGPQNALGNTELSVWGKIIFCGTTKIGAGNKIVVGENALLKLGKDTLVTSMVNIVCYKEIDVGNHSWIVHRCQVMDSNMHYIADFINYKVYPLATPIKIGEYCWICNSTSITGGAIIPDKVIVASNSFVNKDFSTVPPMSLLGGIPAKLIKTGLRKIDNKKFHLEIKTWYASSENEGMFEIKQDISDNICDCIEEEI